MSLIRADGAKTEPIPTEYDGFTYEPGKHLYLEVMNADQNADRVVKGSMLKMMMGGNTVHQKIVHVEPFGDMKRVFAESLPEPRCTISVLKDGEFIPVECITQ